MSLQEQVQLWSDGFFAQLEFEYQHRPLILAVIGKLQRSVNAQIPVLVTQGIDAVVAGLIAVIDKEFAALEAELAVAPGLVDLLKSVNHWIDAEVQKIGKELQS